MGLETIQQAVLETARAEARHIVSAAEKHAADNVRAQKETAERDAEREYQAATRRIEEEFARKLTQLSGAAGKQLLEARNARLGELFETARKQILGWPQEEYGDVMQRLLERTAVGGGTVRVHADDRALFTKLIETINAGRSTDARIALDAAALPTRGGFIFIASEYEVDQTLDTIMTEIERELVPVIAAEVFAG